MVKTYLKYQLKDVVGQISGKQSKACVSNDGKFLYTGCNEYVIVIDVKTGQIAHKIRADSVNNQKSQVTCITIDKSNKQLVAGYTNGTIIVYDIIEGYKVSKKFSLHKSAVTCLEFNASENLLASGSKDTNIIVWDIIGDSALYRLSGHKDGITKIFFKEIHLESIDEGLVEVLISSAKDNTIKIWNIKNQETIQTIADLIHKVTDFAMSENILLVGSYDQKLRLYQFQSIKKETGYKSQNNYFSQKGFVTRQSNAKIISISISHDEKLISILSNDNTIEFLKVLSSKEVKYRIMKTELDKNEKNEKREKLVLKERFEEVSDKTKNLLKNKEYNYKLKYYSLFKFIGENKLLNLNFIKNTGIIFNSSGKTGSKNIYKFSICLGNNSVELYELHTSLLEQNIFYKKGFTIEEKKADEENLNVEKISSLDTFGHRDVLRHINFSERENLFLTTSNESVKLWNYSSLNVIKGINLDSIISTAFILNDKFIVLGSRKGKLYLVNTTSFEIVQQIDSAHTGEIWTIYPVIYSNVDKKYKLITCSSDKTIKYWNVDSSNKNANSINNEIITEYKTTEALDQLTFCMLSPDRKYLIYSMLDNSIKILYEDTNKIFLTLYGHKLPVLSLDVSSDGALLVSGSADKNVKLWGMDFGDCHKSFFAHQDSVTTVKFVNKTHYFFSASKDMVVRYWDGDTYDLIMEMSDFFGHVWSLDINFSGTAMIAVSADYSIRVYELTKEQVIPDWEKERKLDKLIEDEMQKELDLNKGNLNPLNKEIDKIVPIKKSMDNIGYAEDLMDSLEIAEKFKNEVYQYEIGLDEYKKSHQLVKSKNFDKIKAYNLEEPEIPQPSPMLLGKNIFDFVLYKLQSIRHSDLEGALNNLPYSYAQILIFYLEYYIRNNIEIELCARCILFITVLFESQLSNDKTLIKLLQSIRIHLKKNLGLTKDIVSFNIQSIDFIVRSYKSQQKSLEEYKNSYQINKII